MPWMSKRHGHRCRPPSTPPLFRRVESGDVWKCFWCGSCWEVRVSWMPSVGYRLSWRMETEDG